MKPALVVEDLDVFGDGEPAPSPGGEGLPVVHLKFPVIYLGRPDVSVTVEAYRHLVDPYGIPPSAVRPRAFYTVSVEVWAVLDLTVRAHRESVGLTDSDLGQTLALFAQRISASERPVLVDEALWSALPDDPRIPRGVTRRARGGG